MSQEEKDETVTKFMKKLKDSGYDEQFRKEILASAIKAYKKQLEDHKAGIKPFYRPRNWNRKERELRKQNKVKTWITQSAKNYMYVLATPGADLRRRIQKRIEPFNKNLEIKVNEKPGPKLIHEMRKRMKKQNRMACENKVCLMSRTEKGGNCRSSEVVYQIICQKFKDWYYGETSRNGCSRSSEHMQDRNLVSEEGRIKSVLSRHEDLKHEGGKMKYDMKLIKKFEHDPLARQLAEAILIRGSDTDKCFNSKLEYRQPLDVVPEFKKQGEREKKIPAKRKGKKEEAVRKENNNKEKEKVRREQNEVKEKVNDEEEEECGIPAAEMIRLARARRKQPTLLDTYKNKNKSERRQLKCDVCPFISTNK